MKKRLLSFIFALCLMIPCAFMLGACGNSSVEGTYTVSTIETKLSEDAEAKAFTKAEVEAAIADPKTSEAEKFVLENIIQPLFDNKIELKKDSKFTLTSTGEEKTNGTWTKNADKITLTLDAEEGVENAESITITVSDSKLIMEDNTGITPIKIIFSK